MPLIRLLLCLLLLLPGLLQAEVDREALHAQAEQGDAWAQLNLGAAYDHGIGGARDVDRAIHWYHKAAEQGLAEAQFNLAHILVDEDISAAAAADWMAKAAAQGMVDAQYLMGVIYAEGLGVARDDNEARRWLQQAIGKGHTGAAVFMKERYGSAGSPP
jgi:TPR repeat protein